MQARYRDTTQDQLGQDVGDQARDRHDYRVGIDVGGTFTDICLVDVRRGQLGFWKVPSTPGDPSEGMLDGLVEALSISGRAAAEITFLAHGTTVATNMLLEGSGAKAALVTTEGFRDLLETRRGQWPHMYNLEAEKPMKLVERHLCFELPERTLYDGGVERALATPDVEALGARILDRDVEAVAICLLHSYINPEHEHLAAAALRKCAPGIPICTSSDLLPEQGEYERATTTVVNAVLLPKMQAYLESLSARLRAAGVPVEPLINSSSGGVIPAATAATKPVFTIMSGPSAGAVGALEVAKRSGDRSVMTFDMGGTSTDVSLIEGETLPVVTEKEFEGIALEVPTVDVTSIGAGGGSVAKVDEGGLLKVGPESAGATPGPACYLRGGEEPTVTDAMLFLGFLNPVSLLGGRMQVDRGRAEQVIGQAIASRLGVTTEDAAQGIVSIARANIEQALRVVSVQRGEDPRTFALVAYGGAGPQHAAAVAAALGIPRVIVPPSPGTLCALGLLATDLRTDYSKVTRLRVEPESTDAVVAGVAELQQKATDWFESHRIDPVRRSTSVTVDMRYVGQHHELNITVPDTRADASVWDAIAAKFTAEHHRLYGHSSEQPMEIVALRLSALGTVSDVPQDALSAGAAIRGENGPPTDSRLVYIADRWLAAPVYQRHRLVVGQEVAGPCVIEQMDTTVVVEAEHSAVAHDGGNLVISTNPRR